MARPTDSRQKMVRSAARLFRRQGYAATGWRQVIGESQAPWGSQAHHFPGGKEQLAVDAIPLSSDRYERLLRAALAGTHPADAVAGWAEVAATELEASGWADGCPVATVALETADSSAALAAACGGAFAGWRAAFVESFTDRGLSVLDARSLGTLVLAGIEGALLLARADRDTEPLRLVGTELATLIRTRLPPP
jgi:TetR/AcrR family transcriptional repressor of lmrAB and yxaGH operons